MSEKIDIVVSLKDTASRGLSKVGTGLDKLKVKALKTGQALNKSKALFLGIGVAAGAMAVGFLKAAGDLERSEVAFTTMLGSAEKAKDLMIEINKVAIKTPFEQKEIIASTQKLLAFGVAQKDVIKTFTMLGDASQGNAQKLDTLTRAYGKVQAKGKVSMEEINMVTEAGVPILATLGETMEVTQEELFKLSAAGKITAADFEKAFGKMTDEGGIFYNSMIDQSKTLGGLISTVKGNIDLFAQSIGQSLLPFAKKLAIEINRLLTFLMGLSPQMKKTIAAVTVAIAVFAGLLAVLGGIASILPGLIAGLLAVLGGIASILPGLIAGLTGPIGLTVVAIGLAVVGFIQLKKAITEAGSVTNFLKKNFITLGQIVVGQIKRMLTELNKFLKILSKIPGVNINVDEAIANMDKLNAKMEEQKSTSGSEEDDEGELDAESEKEDARTEMLLQKEAERNAALEEQKAAQREENKAIMGKLAAIENEEELARFEEKLALKAEQGKLTTDQEMLIEQKRSELKKANWQKEAECNAALEEQKAAQREENKAIMDELAAIENEEELARFEEKLALKAGQGKLITDQEMLIEQKRSELKKANWQKDFGTWLGIEKLKRVNKKTTAQQMATWESFMLGATRSKNKDVAKIAKALAIKNIVFKTAEAAMSAFNAMAPIPFVGPVLGAAAAGAAIAFGAEQIATVQSQGTALAEGGIVAATPGGIQATIGEGGQDEAVVPLPDESDDEGGGRLGGDILVNVNIDGKPLVKEFYEIEQEMIRTGEIDTGGV